MMSKEELQERALLVRIHQSNCEIEHPTPEELNFRLAIMKKLAIGLDLRELRSREIGPQIANRKS